MTTANVVPLLVYRDVAAAHDYLVEMFGFSPGRIDRAEDGSPMHAEVGIAGLTVWLHNHAPEHGYSSPRDAGTETAGLCIMVDDARAHYTRTVTAGASVVRAPVDQPYGVTEYVVTDVEGRRWTFMSPIHS